MSNDAISELELYGLSIRVIEKLDDHGYVWVTDLEELTAAEFLGWSYTGETMLGELRAALGNYVAGVPVKTIAECTEFKS